MHVELEAVSSLSRLAWCARLQRHGDVVRVRHGPAVLSGVRAWPRTAA